MNQDQPELTFEESLKQVMQTLPPLIRDYLTQGRYTPVARSLMTKYNLRIDQGGVLEREIMLLLMGVENPVEFTEALAEEAKLSKQVIDGIVQDVNNLIFVPLRKEEEKGGTTATEVRPSPQILKAEPQIQPVAPKAVPELTSHFKLENKIPLAHSAPQSQKNEKSDIPVIVSQGSLPPKVFLPRPATLGEVVRSVLAVPLPSPKATEGTAKPLDSNNLLEDHEEPHIAFEAKSPEVEPRGISARPVVAPENLPGAMPEQIIPEVPTPEVSGPFGHNDAPPSSVFKVEPQIQIPIPTEVTPGSIAGEPEVEPRIQKPAPVAPIEPKPVPAPITSYSSDPYREPIDEPPTE